MKVFLGFLFYTPYPTLPLLCASMLLSNKARALSCIHPTLVCRKLPHFSQSHSQSGFNMLQCRRKKRKLRKCFLLLNWFSYSNNKQWNALFIFTHKVINYLTNVNFLKAFWKMYLSKLEFWIISTKCVVVIDNTRWPHFSRKKQ